VKTYKIKSFCKVNLSLRVVKKLSSGYHNIKSLVTFCDPHDVISISETKGKRDKISFSGKFKRKINKKSNTITKALFFLRKNNVLKNKKFKINIQKNIPHGSGLGGGSSNAAELINFLNSRTQFKLNKNKIEKIAKNIGFDTLISLEKKNTYLTGKKNKIIRLLKKFNLNILIVYPNIICSTKKIYQNQDKLKLSKLQNYFSIENRYRLLNFLINEKNDLEKTAIKFYPQIKKIINFIENQEGCYLSRITGSGAACFGIFSNIKTAIYAKKLLQLKFPKYWCVVSKTI